MERISGTVFMNKHVYSPTRVEILLMYQTSQSVV